ncbi:MAG: DUF2585 domain-containing protein [Sphingomonadaceae bacterium]|nr:DUF2585 domain-containing protein [Sphingomonadaceae bacterium]
MAYRVGLPERKYIVAAIAIAAATAAILYFMGRNPIAENGEIKIWVGEVHGPDNSQHIADWYVFSHIIHGFLFAWLGIKLLPNSAAGTRLCLAVAIEASWELLENSPIIINRYREATAAFGYSGDSIVNSMADIGWMVLGFAVARRIGFWKTVIIAVVLELFTLWMICDNLTLNVLMLVWPVDAVREWQSAL